ncbi:translocation/assembly module TamB domain-containing protein [Leptotrichia sp. oral taxon 417]|uniref:translocation/assembly module TamB domain-containing protein n=1 Tax=Leptotrichia sp. oral taxon 417 TaxID=712365 RepID=UPI0015BD33EA|nr:translocation/assembly module TamB domain-containing protein [Leptotrichia sp. oral taxon 417]NWO28075.1 translocation/assembly module TamB domain-containing protein [Leptotrichia sp. oral taxon 417]
MKYIKRSLIVFIFLLMSLFALKFYISTKNFRGVLTSILKSSGLNVEFRNVKLIGFNKIQIDNLKVKDLAGNVVIDAKKTTAGISLLMPTRLNRIDVYNGTVNLERRKNEDFNIFHVIKKDPKKPKTFDTTSRIGKMHIHNSILNFTDTTYSKKIRKTLKKVSGRLEVAKSRGFSLFAKGSGNKNEDGTTEILKVELKQLIKSKQSIYSMFDKIKNSDIRRKDARLNFGFENVRITEELGQYAQVDMIKAKGGILTGALKMEQNKIEKKIHALGSLKIKNGKLSYVDFDGDIEGVNAVVDMKKDKITVNANTKLSESPVTLTMAYFIQTQKMNLKLVADKLPFDQVARYKIIKDAKIEAEGAVSGNLELNIDTKSKKGTLDGKFSSDNIRISNSDFQNVKTNMKITNEKLTLSDTSFIFNQEFSGFKVNEDVKIGKFVYDLKKKTGSGDYVLNNLGSDFDIKKITGSAKISPKNIITGTVRSNVLRGNYTVNPKTQTAVVNARSRGYFNVNYGGKSYKISPDVDNLVAKFNSKNVLRSGIIKARVKDLSVPFIKAIKVKVRIRNGNYRISGTAGMNGGGVLNINGTTTSDMKHSYSLNLPKEVDIAKLLRANGYNFNGLDKAKLPATAEARVHGVNNKFSGTYEIHSPYGEYMGKYKNLHANGKINDLANLDMTVNAKASELQFENQRLRNVTGNLEIKDNVVNIASIRNENLNASGRYDIKSGKMDINARLKNYMFTDNNLPSKMNVKIGTLNANLTGTADKLSGNYELYSPYGEYVVEYEKLHANGKINNLSKLDLTVNAKMDELWLNYQRLKDVTANLEVKDNVVNILSIKNENLNASGNYNLKTGNMNINAGLKDYMLYDTSPYKVNLKVKNLDANLKGTVNKLSGNITIPSAPTTIKSTYVGDTNAHISIKDGIMRFDDVTLRDNRLSGTYNLVTGISDIGLALNEPDIPKLLEMKDLTFGTKSNLNLKGDLNNFNLEGQIAFGNMSFKTYKIPHIVADIKYSNGNIDKLFKYGTFDLQKLRFIGDNQETLFETQTKFDLANVNIDYQLEKQKFSLDSIQDLKDKGYSGDIDFGFMYRGSFDKFISGVKIKADSIKLSGFPVKNVDIDLQANEKSLNIGQFYLEYENNPLLLNGYVQFTPVKYNVSMLAKDFNLDFLGIDKNIEQAGGIANVDAIFSNEATTGHILLNNFNYKTKDQLTLVDNVNANIDLKNSKLIVNRLDGGYNGGTFKVTGDLDVPTIPADFMKTKRLELGKFELNADLNNVGLHYGTGIDFALSGNAIFTENRLFGDLVVNNAQIREIPDFNSSKANTTESQKAKKEQDKSIVEGIVEEVIDKIMKQYTINIGVQAGNNVKINIPNVSLVKNIKGTVKGSSEITYDDGQIGIDGEYGITKGSFSVNGNDFKIDGAEIRFVPSINGVTASVSDPFVVFDASTKVDGDRIEINVSGNVSNPEIRFSSSSGKTREEIISMLALNTLVGNSGKPGENGDNSVDGLVVAGSLVNTALNELFLSSVTGKIKDALGMSKFAVSTNVDRSNKTGEYSATTTLTLQDNLYKDKLFWNAAFKFPYQTSKSDEKNPIGYNAWLSYSVSNGLDLRAGGESFKRSSSSASMGNGSRINYYFGVDFSTKADTFGDILKKIFKKKKLDTLKK